VIFDRVTSDAVEILRVLRGSRNVLPEGLRHVVEDNSCAP
jgi:hypothetical protein